MIITQRILYFLTILQITVYCWQDSLNVIEKSGKWAIVTKENRKEGIEKNKLVKDLNIIDRLLINDISLKKRKYKTASFDTLKYRTTGKKNYEYSTIDNKIFKFEDGRLYFAGMFENNDRPKTREEWEYFERYGKLAESWAVVSHDSAKQIALKFLSEVVQIEDLEQYDSIKVKYSIDGYTISFRTHPGDRCEERRCSVRINANSGNITSYDADNLNCRNYDSDYMPKVTRAQAIAIMLTEFNSNGIKVAFKDSVYNKDEFDYLIGHFCMLPKKEDIYRIKNPEAKGWLWRATLVKPGVFGIYTVLIDTETGEILYFDSSLLRNQKLYNEQKR